MVYLAKAPDSCDHLDLAVVRRILAKNYGDITAAAKELGVSRSDLNRLTWAKPKLLERAHEEMGVIVARAWAELIRSLDSPNDLRREWAAEKILSSYAARDHPYAPMRRRGASVSVSEARTISFRWDSPDGSDDKPAMESFERDGKTFEVPKYGGYAPDGARASDDPIDGELVKQPVLIEHGEPPVPAEPTPEPQQLPKWHGPGGPPPLVAHLYAWVRVSHRAGSGEPEPSR